VIFTGVAGQNCPTVNGTRGNSDSGTDAWSPHASGGWTGDGCTGAFVSARASGDNTYHWWWATNPVPVGTCAVSVFVPAGGSLDSSTAAAYQVLDGPPSGSKTQAGGFPVDQRDHQGSWVDAGGFPVRNGYLDINLTAADSAPGTVAAAAIRVTCTP
jgi:hypothetical protein